MSESTREDILDCMTRLLELAPEMRFGQMVTWVSSMARPDDPDATANVDDDSLLEACQRHLADLERFHSDGGELTAESPVGPAERR
ncbi:hypothetical protein [Planctellipticum variicoloris]|uniref:hypothetical protein n=1 Tax=Planctellipticum variicoloris TaxID=3064265 RepID=UPI003013D620|nr:hypothetical protein SH412_004739 [Planctomycetaceae bacterium SH412]